MSELLKFIGSLNLWTFIVIWTSTIFLVIFISLLLIYVSQMNVTYQYINRVITSVTFIEMKKLELFKNK